MELASTISRKSKMKLHHAVLTDAQALRASISVYTKLSDMKQAADKIPSAEQIITDAERQRLHQKIEQGVPEVK